MGILILIQTINLIILIGKIFYSFWFSYIIFLVFIGGLFILFIYVISLVYNNKFFSLNSNKYLIIILLRAIIALIIINYKIYFLTTNDIILKINNNWLIKENILYNLKFYNIPNNIINLILIIYLFLIIVIVVKITNFYSGPIKSIN